MRIYISDSERLALITAIAYWLKRLPEALENLELESVLQKLDEDEDE